VITGIQVLIRRRALSGVGIVDHEVRLFDGATFSATDHAATSIEWENTYEEISYGGPGDLWGESWTPDIVNSYGFGVALSVYYASTAGNDWPYVDHISVTVYYDVVCE
jgi:hypothetical protein